MSDATELRSGQMVRRAREALGLTLRELGEKVGASAPHLSDWERGKKEASAMLALLVAKELDMDTQSLIAALEAERHERKISSIQSKYDKRRSIELQLPNLAIHGAVVISDSTSESVPDSITSFVQVPILGTIPAGDPIRVTPMMAKDAEEFELVPTEDLTDPVRVFGLRVHGQSMTGRSIDEGDVIIIDTAVELESGNIAVVMLGEEATVKIIYYEEGQIILQGANPYVEPRVVKQGADEPFRVIGRVIRIIKKA